MADEHDRLDHRAWTVYCGYYRRGDSGGDPNCSDAVSNTEVTVRNAGPPSRPIMASIGLSARLLRGR